MHPSHQIGRRRWGDLWRVLMENRAVQGGGSVLLSAETWPQCQKHHCVAIHSYTTLRDTPHTSSNSVHVSFPKVCWPNIDWHIFSAAFSM
eukprot:COSAG01_NODE_198_length_22280_cov_21.529775_9_plen_90_part_00